MPIPERKEIEEAFECYKRFDNDKRNIYDLREGEFNLISKQLAKSRETYSKLVKAYLSGELVNPMSEDDLGIFMLESYRGCSHKTAVDIWTGKHYQSAQKTMIAELAHAISQAQKGEVK